jgi:methionyl-tRNA formyltransferase
MSALEVYDLHRALYSFKSLTTTFRNEVVKLLEVSKNESDVDHVEPGCIKFSWKLKKILVGCRDGKSIAVSKLSLGKKTMSASDFRNGFLSKLDHDRDKKFE